MKQLILHTEAREELRAAAAYYEGQRKGLGRDFRSAVEEAFRFLQQFPRTGSLIEGTDLRKRLVRRFPHGIIYAELDDAIFIVAVAHQKRKPGYWSSRTLE